MILSGNASKTLPQIIFEEEEGTVKMTGKSVSTEVNEYFREFIPYFKECIEKDPKNLKIDIDLEYFNTSTSKQLMDFFNIAKHVKKHNFDIDINWYIDNEDEDMLEAGEDYISLTGLNINIIHKTE